MEGLMGSALEFILIILSTLEHGKIRKGLTSQNLYVSNNK